jgi:Niemann-Pick C1 protein
MEKQYFDESFGAFFRVQQMIITNKTERSLLDVNSILDLYEIQKEIKEIAIPDINNPRNVIELKDLCFKPMADSNGCMVDSVVEYFQNNKDNIIRRSNQRNGIMKHLHDCL